MEGTYSRLERDFYIMMIARLAERLVISQDNSEWLLQRAEANEDPDYVAEF